MGLRPCQRRALGSSCSPTGCARAHSIAIVEAVAAGLIAVSTNVGGVPEVFPPDMIRLARPEPDDIEARLHDAIGAIDTHDAFAQHERVRTMYSWRDVARRTEIVYNRIVDSAPVPLVERLRRYYGCGLFAGKLNCCAVATNHLWLRVLEWTQPRAAMDEAPEAADGELLQL